MRVQPLKIASRVSSAHPRNSSPAEALRAAHEARFLDLNGDGSFTSPAFGPTDEKNETRTFSTVNEMSTRVNSGVTKNPAYNANGQQTDDGVNYTYEWDAFGRLRKVKNRSNSALVVEYTYNGLNHQIGRHADLDADGDVDSTDKWEWTIYDPRWRRVATYMVAGGSTFTGAVDSDPRERYVHHASGRSGMGSYIDSVILRDRDQTGSNNSSADATMEQRLYYAQNWRADVSVTMTDTGRILERIKYSAYGVATRVPVTDFNGDGAVDFFDDMAYDDCYTGVSCPSGQTADMNLDGFVDSFDYDEWDLTFSEQGSTARGVLSQSSGSAAVNRIGYAGYWFEPSTQQYLVRNRELDPLVGVWDERDPLSYHDSSDLYSYVSSRPLTGLDAMGLSSDDVACNRLKQDLAGCISPNDPAWPQICMLLRHVQMACGPHIMIARCRKCNDVNAGAARQAVSSMQLRQGYLPATGFGRCSQDQFLAAVGECTNYLREANDPNGSFCNAGLYECQTDTLTLCSDCGNLSTRARTLVHELIHRFDNCRQNADPRNCSAIGSCADRICTEYRAYSLARSGPGRLGKTCGQACSSAMCVDGGLDCCWSCAMMACENTCRLDLNPRLPNLTPLVPWWELPIRTNPFSE